jgi:predicted AAA+ superfamily ATPase
MEIDPWHYPRRDFAQRTLAALMQGPVAAMTLFGPRRIGKTQFLQRDLGALASLRGHTVLYASFWQVASDPVAILLYQADRALQKRSYAEKLRGWDGSLPVRAKLAILGQQVELGHSLPTAVQPDRLLALDDLFGRLANPDFPALLMLDEVQELAHHAEGDAVLSALRSSLDTRRDGLRTVFTGSSQVGLNKLFSTRAAPFFRFATPLSLPQLSDDFVDHQLRAFKAAYRRPLDRAEALLFFRRFNSFPEVFNRWLTTLGQNPAMSAAEASLRTADEIARQFDHAGIWRGLSALMRAMARVVAERRPGLFGDGAGPRLAELLRQAEPPAAAQRQSALRTLLRRRVVDQIEKDYHVADPLFEPWILDRTPEDF